MGTSNTASQIVFHGVNNYFQNIDGHAFDIDTNTWVLIEGNYFENTKTPMTSGSLTAGGQIYNVISVNDASGCTGNLGYICEWNRLSGSGSMASLTSSAALQRLGQYRGSLVSHIGVADVPSKVRASAGIGKI